MHHKKTGESPSRYDFYDCSFHEWNKLYKLWIKKNFFYIPLKISSQSGVAVRLRVGCLSWTPLKMLPVQFTQVLFYSTIFSDRKKEGGVVKVNSKLKNCGRRKGFNARIPSTNFCWRRTVNYIFVAELFALKCEDEGKCLTPSTELTGLRQTPTLGMVESRFPTNHEHWTNHTVMCSPAPVTDGFAGQPGYLTLSEGRVDWTISYRFSVSYVTLKSPCCFVV